MTPGARLAQLGAVALSLTAGPAAATDAVVVGGRLSDVDFYRLVSCAAPPGGDCATQARRWRSERPIRVALRRIDPAYLGRRKLRADAALTRALQHLNAAEAGFRLARVGPTDPAEIEVFFLGLAVGDVIAGTGVDGIDGVEIAETAMRLAINPAGDIIEGAAIVVSASLETPAYEAAMLKQMTRAMGLTTEIDAPVYRAVSALARGNEGPTELGPQDLAALRRHYQRN